MNELSRFLPDEAATLAVGEQLACAIREIPSPHALVIYLQGNLGAGKTTLSRGLLQALGHQGTVKSPTYTLVEPYDLACGTIYHFDLYRVKDPQELDFIGAQDYFDHGRLCLVEWPERGGGRLPEPDVAIQLAIDKTGRYITLAASTMTGEKILAAFSSQAFTPAIK